MIKSVYLDTSVIGGYFDEEFSENTIPFFERIIQDKIKVYVSDLLISELSGAPNFVRELLDEIPLDQKIHIELNQDAIDLGDRYIFEGVVGKTSRADCQHIALATLANVDVLVSWNFKHIVNLERIRGYNGINIILGHKPIEIRTPQEIEIL
ncbi:PIN domain-containing protein [Marivirga salinae]|uniref:PIN domain-containing protein n=1 Tax=Marivirga salinarum TaxID=3059078 RepID=A0AA49JBH9_9BACT|nr:PIN domain-containing protein [Marivirga sp. BDSF4-3]WKK75810.2 PIN domain-containing protein [Marivirga sp. BDSF4-3]